MNRRPDVDRRLVVLAIALISVSGFVGFSTRKSREDPKSRVRWGYVTTEFPGAQPHEVESLVSEPIEKALREAGTVRSIESSSLRGVSLVFIRLTDEATDVDQSWLKIQDKLSQVAGKLPDRASAPILVDERQWGSHTRVVGLYERSPEPMPIGVLARWSKELNNRLSFVPGTRFTELFGLPEEEVLVEIDEATIASTRLTTRDIVDRLRARDSGRLDSTSQSGPNTMPVDLSGDLRALEDIGDLLILNGDGNRHVRLGDLATIRRCERQPRRESAFIHGRRAVVVATRMDDSYGIDSWTRAQNAVLEEFAASLPEQLGLAIVFNQQKYTDDRAASLYKSLGIGIILVVVTICWMMGWRAAIPICAALPLTLAITFTLMIPVDAALHQMSIAGLILALGMLVDNPIIVVDDMQRRLDRGLDHVSAYRESVRHLKGPLIGSNVTTVLGFTPILLLGGPTGEFMQQLGWSVISCLLGSLVLSLTLIPILSSYCLKPNATPVSIAEAKRSDGQSGGLWSRVLRRVLRSTLRTPMLLIAPTLLICSFGFVISPALQEQFFPAAERNHFHFSVRLPTHASISKTEQVAMRAREITLRHIEVEEVAIFVGRSAPKLHYSMVGLEDNRPNFAQGLVQLKTDRVPVDLIHKLQAEFDRQIPEAQCIVRLIEQGPPAPAPIELRIYGRSLDQLHDLGREAQSLLMQESGIIHTRMAHEPGGPVLGIRVSQTDSEQAGLDSESISQQVRDSFDGLVMASMSEGIEEIPIRVRLTDSATSHPARIVSLPLVATQSLRKLVPINALAEPTVEHQKFCIYRRNSSRCNIVYAYTRAGSLPVSIEEKFKDKWETLAKELPPGYRYDFGGISHERNSAVSNLMAYSLVIGMLMFATLVVTFRSFRLAIIIVCVASLSVGLGLTSLWVFQYPIGIVAIIGIAGLVGLAVNDSIVVLSECQSDASKQLDVTHSIMGASRHVFTTSVTTVAGVLPLILAGGDFWPPMMIVIAGGIVGATLIALGFTPACYVWLTRKSRATQ
ncbi:Cobalt-zinc-cadmium resistance protein CzcA [Stieleria maiorica]|uniref:Cobalt-zinc-cadmium resistance protein CzcA n=1 Tax=Stieleria maiorica TaxID=2795974 RepID=A0A5B9MJ51_9BACT|nr:efflux RND transporter permease subunit [Stieleria maiorica]QEF99674.1 Cobalt-zinc-cadmium resistance protein CzcA [Stieleria maiorica]